MIEFQEINSHDGNPQSRWIGGHHRSVRVESKMCGDEQRGGNVGSKEFTAENSRYSRAISRTNYPVEMFTRTNM